MVKVMSLCLGMEQGDNNLGQYVKTEMVDKIEREVSMRPCLVGGWMTSEEGPCPNLARGSSFWHWGEACVCHISKGLNGGSVSEGTVAIIREAPARWWQWKYEVGDGESMKAKVKKIWPDVQV